MSRTYSDTSWTQEKRKKRIEREEKELEELMKGTSPKEEEEENQEEEVQEEVKQEDKTEEKVESKDDEDKELGAEEKTFKKRYGDLRRHLAEKEKAWQAKLDEATNANKGISPPKSDEDLAAWAKKYPDVASIVETIAKKKAEEMFKVAEERFRKFDETEYERARETAEQQIMNAHSDFAKLRDSDEFHNWADDQPKWVKDALYENEDDARSVIRVIDLYKADMGLTKKDRKDDAKEAAKSVKGGSKTSPDPDEGAKKIHESTVEKMSAKEFEKNLEAINKAIATGNFVYDISGGAR